MTELRGMVVCGLLAVSVLAVVSSCREREKPAEPTPTPVEPTPVPDVDETTLSLWWSHDETRDASGVVKLTLSPALTRAALSHARWMAREGRLSHVGDRGSRFSDRIADAGYAMRSGGENIAQGYSSVEAVMNGWMNSPGHRANILNGGCVDAGFARVRDARGVSWWCAVFASPASVLRSSEADDETEIQLPGGLSESDE